MGLSVRGKNAEPAKITLRVSISAAMKPNAIAEIVMLDPENKKAKDPNMATDNGRMIVILDSAASIHCN